MTVVAVVLAGGESRRFGSDKLAAELDEQTLLDHTLAALPDAFTVIVVGPQRVTQRPVVFTREQPPGGGPAAGLVAGLHTALEHDPDVIVVLPGDAPAAGRGMPALVAALADHPAVVAVDGVGQWQPLQLALRPDAARHLVELAGPDGAAGRSARRLIAGLDPALVDLAADRVFDVDTPDQLLVWRLRTGRTVTRVVAAIAARRSAAVGGPVVVAIDGPGGAGKSTLAAAVALRTGGIVVEGDDFYSPALARRGPAERDRMSDAEAVDAVIDWRRLRREVLEPLRQGRDATYRPYDWAAHDGRLAAATTVPAGDPVIVEGVYSARPELADLLDLTVHLAVAPAVRSARLAERADPADWAAFWERAEQHYFARVRPPGSFDLRFVDPA